MAMADRVAVMNQGVVEQIGSPSEIYDRPASLFVADFIGSPPMNLLAGQADGTRFVVDGQTLPLPAAAPRAGPLLLGLRPEHAQLDPAGTWVLQVDLLEMLGAERLVYGRIGGAAFTLRIEATLPPPRPGDAVRLRVPPDCLHWFDPESGLRVGA